LPNKTHPDSPVGGEERNRLVREVPANNELVQNQSLPNNMSHIEIAQHFDLIDFNNASKLTGHKFVFIKNELAILELALSNWVFNLVAKKGFTPMLPPEIARSQVVEACGFQPRDAASQIYKIDGSNECLIGTSEIPLAGMYANEIVDRNQLTHKMVAYSHCFRAEAGRGQHSHGLYRLHQFSKVEMLGLTEGHIDDSEALLAEFLGVQEEIIQQLGFRYKVLDMATEELGAAAYRKFDVEAWMPSKKAFGEISSASNCTSYQSRRLNINYFDQNNNRKLVHTVNGTAMAIPRILLTLIETYWDRERNVIELPKVLHPLLPFDRIEIPRSNIIL
jgi:seryl-tRNA synthetase